MKMYSLVCILIFLIFAGLHHISFSSSEFSSQFQAKGIVLIPEISSLSRLIIAESNLKKFVIDNNNVMRWDCMVFLTASRTDREFYQKLAASFISTFCIVVENPGKVIGDNLLIANPLFLQKSFSYVFLLSENCLLHESFKFDQMYRSFLWNNLTVASPLVENSNRLRSQRFRDIMQTPGENGTDGHITSFLSINAWLMTMRAYRALWELVHPSLNPDGWGYDLWFDLYAKSRIGNHKMGIITSCRAEAVASPAEQDTLRSPQIKWSEQLKQEKYYENYYGVSLKDYRKATRQFPLLGALEIPLK